MSIAFHGIGLDAEGRCTHYHQASDVVALKCAQCGRYYACYQCHDALEHHRFMATGPDGPTPTLCCACNTALSHEQYSQGACPACGHEFNPRCALHKDIYFTGR
ncbi:MAG: CHY zinc finger protein [Propionibacterium sp.]|nr:CHY zinc finger protein [Propionibacterium sp.]